ncbi:MAG: glutamate ligase domain-containing protein [Collinsella sp.]
MVKPAYQPQNAACAIMLCEGIWVASSITTARCVAWAAHAGPFDVLGTDPLKLIDACHNPQSCDNFVSALDEIDPCVENRPTLLCAALADKDVAGIVDVLIPAFPRVVVTQTDSDRALPAEELAALVDAGKLAGVYPSVSEALAAFEAAGEPFVAAGTITLAGEVAGLLR